mgnify:FL=1|tara:strand:+ start:2623 stop:2865 length:243 start_codon:yes stop_codon:yes gene_type:complete
MSKIDTQGMGISRTKSKKASRTNPMSVTPRRVITPELVKELKILINEVLDEREGRMNRTSYFDVEKFSHTVLEEEPEYGF